MLDKTPLLSICIPTYNRAQYLAQSLQSITSQITEEMAGHIEFIINDNASTDNTREIALNYCKKYSYMKYFCNPVNISGQHNMFTVMKKAAGKYIWVYGDDDLLREGAVSRVISLLQKDAYDFIMINMSIKNVDMSETVVENLSPSNVDSVFPDIRDVCCEFGFFAQLGFISTAIYKRQEFLAVDPEPYLSIGMEYAQSGVLLEAFRNRPCFFVSDVLLDRRFMTNENLAKFALYCHTTGVIRLFNILVKKGIIDYPFIERIKEKPIGRNSPTLLYEMLFVLEVLTQNNILMTQGDWVEILGFLSHFENEGYWKKALQIYSEYVARLVVEHFTGVARTQFLDKLLEDDFRAPEAHQLEIDKVALSIIGQRILDDPKVNLLTQPSVEPNFLQVIKSEDLEKQLELQNKDFETRRLYLESSSTRAIVLVVIMRILRHVTTRNMRKPLENLYSYFQYKQMGKRRNIEIQKH